MKNKIALFLTVVTLPFFTAQATEIDKNTAKLQAMDKITGRVSVIEVPVGGETKFGSLSVVVRSCKTRPAEETPDNFVFMDITDTDLKGEEFNVFKGWMISSSPATNALEHPIYDVWPLQCLDTDINAKTLWTAKQLAKRDSLPMVNKHENTENTPKASLETSSEADNQIKEMQDIEKPTTDDTMPLMDNEFSFDEDESVESEAEIVEGEAEIAEEKPEQ